MISFLTQLLAFLSGGIITVVALLVCAVATESEDETEKGIVARRSRVGQASSGHTGLHYQPTFRAPMFQHQPPEDIPLIISLRAGYELGISRETVC